MKTILITGARSPATLDLARQLHSSGYKVCVADTSPWNICRFSNCIDAIFVVPSPRFYPEKFADTLASIAEQKQIDLVIPTCEEILTIAKYRGRFPKGCEIFSASFENVHELHSKWLFIKKIEKLGFAIPKTILIENADQIHQLDFASHAYALKPCYSRASVRTQKVSEEKPIPDIYIEPFNPFIAQEWLEGEKFCSYSVCRNGVVQAHTTYPVEYAIENRSCVSFRHVQHQGIYEWIKRFVAQEKFTGQIAFDFIETDKDLYAIECNPRATHGLLLFQNEDYLHRAFAETNMQTIFPKTTTKKQIAMGMLMYGWKSDKAKRNRKQFLRSLFTTRDVVFSKSDLKPFITMPFLFFRYIWLSWKLKITIPAAFTYDLDWNGEELLEKVENFSKEPQESF